MKLWNGEQLEWRREREKGRLKFLSKAKPRLLISSGLRSLLKTVCVSSAGLIEITARIQIVLAADLKPNLFISGSDLQDFMIDFL